MWWIFFCLVDNFLCGGFFFCLVDDQVGGAAGQILEKKNKVATNQQRPQFDKFACKKVNAITKHSIKGRLQIKHGMDFLKPLN